MVWCCGLFGEGLLVGGGLEEGFWGGLGELGRVVWEGLRYERGERGEGRGERGEGRGEMEVGRSGCGRSGLEGVVVWMAAGTEGLVVSKGARREVCGVKWKYL